MNEPRKNPEKMAVWWCNGLLWTVCETTTVLDLTTSSSCSIVLECRVVFVLLCYGTICLRSQWNSAPRFWSHAEFRVPDVAGKTNLGKGRLSLEVEATHV